VEAIRRARSFGGDATVLADYALTTTIFAECNKLLFGGVKGAQQYWLGNTKIILPVRKSRFSSVQWFHRSLSRHSHSEQEKDPFKNRVL